MIVPASSSIATRNPSSANAGLCAGIGFAFHGFAFPVVIIPDHIFVVEWTREVMTLLMLIAGYLTHERMHAKGLTLRLSLAEWAVAIAGALIIIVAFCWNWRVVVDEVTPESFPAAVFFVGLAAGAIPFARAGLHSNQRGSSPDGASP